MSEPAQTSPPDQEVDARPDAVCVGGTARPLFVGLLLIAMTLRIYWPVVGFEFVNYDDQIYVTENDHVLKGISWDNVRWAFTNLEAGFWHPLTWLSYMLDCQLFGPRPGWFH